MKESQFAQFVEGNQDTKKIQTNLLWFTSHSDSLCVFWFTRPKKLFLFAFEQIARNKVWLVNQKWSNKWIGLGLIPIPDAFLPAVNSCMCNEHAIPFAFFSVINMFFYGHMSHFEFSPGIACVRSLSLSLSCWWCFFSFNSFSFDYCLYFIEFHFHSMFILIFFSYVEVIVINRNIWNGSFVKVTQTPNSLAHTHASWKHDPLWNVAAPWILDKYLFSKFYHVSIIPRKKMCNFFFSQFISTILIYF